MKAAVYYETGAPSVFKYEDVPDPELHPKGVVIDVKAIGIEGGDVLNRAGGDLVRKPHIVGYNCAGVVREAGAEVTDRKPGDRVTALMANGSHASMVAVPSTSTWLIPDGVSFDQAACVPVAFGTAHDCVHEFGRVKAGETVLIQAGTSGVGIACVQIAKRAGATVIATSSSDEKLERLREYGMDHGVNYASAPGGGFVEQVRKLTNGAGCDLIVDSVGGKTLEGSILCAGYRGRVITVGNVSREGKAIDVGPLSGANASLTGVFFGLETFRSAARVVPMMNQLLADIAKGDLKVAVDRTYPLSEAAAAHAYIESRQAFGRVVLLP
jgi:NADPH2:quinone reductase